MQREQRFDAIDHAGPFPRDGEQLAVELTAILVIDTRDGHHAPHAAFTAVKPSELCEQRRRIESVRLRLPGAPRALNARGVDDDIRHAKRRERAMHPEAIAPGLVATHDRRFARQGEARFRGEQLVRERRQITRAHRANSWR